MEFRELISQQINLLHSLRLVLESYSFPLPEIKAVWELGVARFRKIRILKKPRNITFPCIRKSLSVQYTQKAF